MSSRKRRGLGQGLGALIPTAADSSGGDGLRTIPIDHILPNPYQPRGEMEAVKLEELTQSISEHGIIQPLIVTQLEDGAVGERFQLIAGERRWRAAKRAGLAAVPVVIKEATEQQMLELALIENIQRADLNPLEEAVAFQQMAELGSMTQNEIASRVGKSRSAIANTMRLLQLPEPLQEMVRRAELSEGHARTLLALGDASRMMEAAQLFVSKEFTVRQAEEWVKRELRGATTAAPKAALSIQDKALQHQFAAALGTRVELRRRRKGGQLVIHFDNEEDLQSIYDTILDE
ncbi:MAG: ParB/RepB/Spo0J family partition protein [Anaerolineales bacterium]|nr:ParB/RepB/Spo0J family partition protein [Anaerolineales bacterium]MCB9129004.1 ParB/RepB/Spo0J family partition protein [Ardenticatenales bacterium]